MFDKIKIICTDEYYKGKIIGKIIKYFSTRIASIIASEQSLVWGVL